MEILKFQEQMINKQNVGHPNNRIFNAAVKRNEVLEHAIIRMSLENIMLSGRSQTLKAIDYMFPLI